MKVAEAFPNLDGPLDSLFRLPLPTSFGLQHCLDAGHIAALVRGIRLQILIDNI